MALALGLRPKTVVMWGVRDAIPARLELTVWHMAQQRGINWRPRHAPVEMNNLPSSLSKRPA